MDYRLKSSEAERDLIRQQLAFVDTAKREEVDAVREEFERREEERVREMREKCELIRKEMEERYKERVEKKAEKFRQEYAIGREKEVRVELGAEID